MLEHPIIIGVLVGLFLFGIGSIVNELKKNQKTLSEMHKLHEKNTSSINSINEHVYTIRKKLPARVDFDPHDGTETTID